MRSILVYVIVLVTAVYSAASATIINVPGDYPTIQQGINAADYWGGDTVLVQPGTYNEALYMGDVTLASLFLLTRNEEHITSTIIDGSVSFRIGSENGKITGFTIQNSAGSGISCLEAGPTITNNIVRNNAWGGIYCANWAGGHPVIRQNILYGNSARWGGAILCEYYSSPTIENNLIYGNHSTENGGAISFVYYSGGTVNNNTIYGNSTDGYGGGIYCSQSSPTISNSIFWADSAGEEGNEIYVASGSPWLEYCDIEGGWGDNMDANPLFRDPQNGDFHLMWTECDDAHDSPCIDSGNWFDNVLGCEWGLGTEWGDMGAYGGAAIPTDIANNENLIIPIAIRMYQNYPNPFNARTIIQYSLPTSSEISVSVYDVLGRRISTVFDGLKVSGNHAVLWNAPDLPSGIYFARLQAGGQNATVKMVLVR